MKHSTHRFLAYLGIVALVFSSGTRLLAQGYYATVAGGWNNTATGSYSTVGGGSNNLASGYASVITGGAENIGSGNYTTVSGGFNTGGGVASAVTGGAFNSASGNYSIVAGGGGNVASGFVSFAAGCGANTNNQSGAFVWGDSGCTGLNATAPNQFMARASGGVIFYSNTGLTSGVQLAAGGGSWSSVSDRNVKEHFAPVDNQQLLLRVLALPVTTWNYKTQDASIRHIGPMAQDFFTAFKVGEDDHHITEIDEGGVALAAVQGLNQKLEEQLRQKDAQLSAQQKQIEALQQQMNQMMQRVAAVEKTSPTNARGSVIAALR